MIDMKKAEFSHKNKAVTFLIILTNNYIAIKLSE